MSVEKLTFAKISAPEHSLDDLLRVCLASGCFHPENALSLLSGVGGYAPADSGSNPWDTPLADALDLCKACGVEPDYSDPSALGLTDDGLAERTNALAAEYGKLSEGIKTLTEEAEHCKRSIAQLSHMKNINYELDSLFKLQHVKLRFGRMPSESYEKLRLYEDNPFIVFVPGSVEKNYVWGCYFAPASAEAAVDDVFTSLYFERLRIADDAHGTPVEALERFTARRDEIAGKLTELKSAVTKFKSAHSDECRKLYSRLKYLRESFELRGYAAVRDGDAVLMGWIPAKYEDSLKESAAAIENAKCEFGAKPGGSDPTPPTKIKNPALFRPFEMFVKMYGVPSAGELDPTPVVAVIYSLLFGAMFGDVGHGLVLIIAGIIADRVMHIQLGKVMKVIGGTSMVFGLIYGSVFGFEHLLDPLYRLIGFEEKPIDVMEGGMINTILFTTIGVGAVIILTAMVVNIINGIRQKDATKMLFAQSGMAGILFYGSVVVAVALIMLLGENLLSPWFICIFVVLPLILIFLREPLGALISKHRGGEEEKLSIGEFILQNVFEMIEILLSYVSNTISFIRVGAFIMSHAIMMSVVFMLAENAAAATNAVILILGNVFVIALEGLIVGIQVLRLQFYEIFGRFYSGGGREFVPVHIDYKA